MSGAMCKDFVLGGIIFVCIAALSFQIKRLLDENLRLKLEIINLNKSNDSLRFYLSDYVKAHLIWLNTKSKMTEEEKERWHHENFGLLRPLYGGGKNSSGEVDGSG